MNPWARQDRTYPLGLQEMFLRYYGVTAGGSTEGAEPKFE